MQDQQYLFEHRGFCPICEAEATFRADNAWFRDHLFCSGCASIPRERAIMRVVKELFPSYRELAVHEAAPCDRGASAKLRAECPRYSATHFYPDIAPGTVNPASGFRCENLSALTYPDASFDVFITQDVMEHIFEPEQTFREIARVLKPGGAHIFTVPLINKGRRTETWATRQPDGQIVHHHPPEWHGNPADPQGSLVTMHWGYDIAAFIVEAARTPTAIFTIDDIDNGIRAEYIDVLASWKY